MYPSCFAYCVDFETVLYIMDKLTPLIDCFAFTINLKTYKWAAMFIVIRLLTLKWISLTSSFKMDLSYSAWYYWNSNMFPNASQRLSQKGCGRCTVSGFSCREATASIPDILSLHECKSCNKLCLLIVTFVGYFSRYSEALDRLCSSTVDRAWSNWLYWHFLMHSLAI